MNPHGDFEENVEGTAMFQDHASHDPEKKAESSITQMHIDKALENLAPRERWIFVLRHYNDMPLKVPLAQSLYLVQLLDLVEN